MPPWRAVWRTPTLAPPKAKVVFVTRRRQSSLGETPESDGRQATVAGPQAGRLLIEAEEWPKAKMDFCLTMLQTPLPLHFPSVPAMVPLSLSSLVARCIADKADASRHRRQCLRTAARDLRVEVVTARGCATASFRPWSSASGVAGGALVADGQRGVRSGEPAGKRRGRRCHQR
jgi:hypothetical protein